MKVPEMKQSDIEDVYGETIFWRGMDYYESGNVLSAVKIKNVLRGEIDGNYTYFTTVNLDNLNCECSCPYGLNCKHGAALLLQYLNEEYDDGDEVIKRLDNMGKKELREIIDRLISMNPSNLQYLLIPKENDIESINETNVLLEKKLVIKIRRLEDSDSDYGTADDFARFIKINENIITKEQIFDILENLVLNSEDFGNFYDEYSDSYYAENIFENLCDAFVKKDLNKDDFERLKDLSEKNNYDMLSSFFFRFMQIDDISNLKEYEEYFHEFLGDHFYLDFLIKCGLIEKAESLIESYDSLDEKSRFRLYLKIDTEKALDFAYRKDFFSSLIHYYHEISEYEKAVELFTEVVNDEIKIRQLKDDVNLHMDIFDSLNKIDNMKIQKEGLRSLFEICYPLNYFGLCVDIGIKLDDKNLLKKLIDKKSDYNFSNGKKIILLDYLKDDYGEEIIKELKMLTSSLIKEMNKKSYQIATNCIFRLRTLISEEKWEEYVKGIYQGHSAKINLWKEFKKRGISLKKRKGVVTLEK